MSLPALLGLLNCRLLLQAALQVPCCYSSSLSPAYQEFSMKPLQQHPCLCAPVTAVKLWVGRSSCLHVPNLAVDLQERPHHCEQGTG